MSISCVRGGLVWLALSGILSACGADSTPSSRRMTGTPATAGTGWPSHSGGATAGAPGLPGTAVGAPPVASSGPAQPLPPPGAIKQDPICEVVSLTADPQTPDMMIVLDRSGSMNVGGRWQPSVSAVRSVTTELQSRIRFGLAMFPDPAMKDPAMAATSAVDCLNRPDVQKCLDDLTAQVSASVCAPGAVVVPVAEMNAMPIGLALDATQPNGGTPTSQTLEKLLETFANPPSGPDAKGVHAKYVLLVTDGQPTCPAGAGQETTQPDIDASNKAIDALLAKEVRTYVIGYDTTGPDNAMLASVLDGFATRGGTGDMKHRPVEDEASLLTELQTIAAQIVGCSFTLDKPPSRADFVLVKLDGKQVNLDQVDGWKLVGDRTIELTGQACEAFRSPGLHVLDAQVQCGVVGPG